MGRLVCTVLCGFGLLHVSSFILGSLCVEGLCMVIAVSVPVHFLSSGWGVSNQKALM